MIALGYLFCVIGLHDWYGWAPTGKHGVFEGRVCCRCGRNEVRSVRDV